MIYPKWLSRLLHSIDALLIRRNAFRGMPKGQARKNARDDGVFYALTLVAVLLWGAVFSAQSYDLLLPKPVVQQAATVAPICDDEPMRVAKKVCRE